MDKCFYHPKAAAVSKCVGCKNTVCATCRDDGKRGLCTTCVQKREGVRPAAPRAEIVYCFRHDDIRASAQCATCSRPYCPACLNTGFRGVTPVFELLSVGKSLKPLLKAGVSDEDWLKAAEADGMTPFSKELARLIQKGLTSEIEARRWGLNIQG